MIIVNLDENTVQQSASKDNSAFAFPLPSKLAQQLKAELKSRPKMEPTQAIADAFLSFWVVLLQHARFEERRMTTEKGTIKFNIDSFVNETRQSYPELLPTIEALSHAQMFQQFVDGRVQPGFDPSVQQNSYDQLHEASFVHLTNYQAVVKRANAISGAKAELSAVEMALRRTSLKAHLSMKTIGGMATSYAKEMMQSMASDRMIGEHHKVAETTLDLTSTSPPSRPSKVVLPELIRASFDSRLFDYVVEPMWVRLGDCAGKNWRHGEKALLLLDILLKEGCDRVVLFALQPGKKHLLDELARYESSEIEAMRKLRELALKALQKVNNLFELRSLRKYAVVSARRWPLGLAPAQH